MSDESVLRDTLERGDLQSLADLLNGPLSRLKAAFCNQSGNGNGSRISNLAALAVKLHVLGRINLVTHDTGELLEFLQREIDTKHQRGLEVADMRAQARKMVASPPFPIFPNTFDERHPGTVFPDDTPSSGLT